MRAIGCSIFDTAIGTCAIAWSDVGIVGSQLPEGSREATLARLQARHGGVESSVPPAHVQAVIDAIVALLAGDDRDLSGVELDMEAVPEFHRRVYAVARTIARGETRTYGEIAARLGDRMLARAVGQALGKNPFAPIVPCHRVLAANGAMGGFSATGGLSTKRRMLTIEGVDFEGPQLKLGL